MGGAGVGGAAVPTRTARTATGTSRAAARTRSPAVSCTVGDLTRLPATFRDASPDGDALIRAAVQAVRIADAFPAPGQRRRLREEVAATLGTVPAAASDGGAR
ncbi:hypothetical protein [Embleya hyalina]|uniref:Uncharacterized protein n=1 Tax=Embleya hyalina TaxID=516124 RepID=A0A401YX74_9ACTN|nr:hypothetical protein [Embleya hyalina]GCD99214.1 hypothetical protein EHYA_06927 [Embleya hyalina]